MKRYEILNQIIKSKNYKSYLEIGVDSGECITRIQCVHKVGVDPNPLSSATTHAMTSDQYFEQLGPEYFDVIFIDGNHLEHQVDKDITNALNHLTEHGCIVLHDCNPPTELHAGETPVQESPINGAWNGTVYRSLAKLRMGRDDLLLVTVDSDWGVGVITRESSSCLDIPMHDALSWKYFDQHRETILGLISIAEFNARYPIPSERCWINGGTPQPFSVVESSSWNTNEFGTEYRDLAITNFHRCAWTISTHAGSILVIDVSRNVSLVGFLNGLPTYPPTTEFFVDGRTIGVAHQGFDSSRRVLLAPGRHLLEIRTKSGCRGHAIWGFEPENGGGRNPNHYVTVATICRNGNSSITEWIKYHIALGVSQIYVLDCGTNTSIADSVSNEGLEEWVTVETCFDAGSIDETEQYNYLIQKYRADCYWMALIDVDDFIVPKLTKNLKRYLSSFEDYGCLRVTRVLFDSSNNGEAGESRSFRDRTRCHPTSTAKLIVRPRYVVEIRGSYHVVLMAGARAVNENFGPPEENGRIQHIQINHYLPHEDSKPPETNDARFIFRDNSLQILLANEPAKIEIDEIPPIVGFIHTAAVNHWEALLHSQIRKAKQSGLLERSREIKVGIVGASQDIVRTLNWLPEKVKVASITDNLYAFEFPTLDLLQQECLKNNAYVWYVHSKGVVNVGDSQNDWRSRMEEFVLVHHEIAVDRLDRGYCAAGGDGTLNPAWHFPGNFWWARGDHVASLPLISTLDTLNRWEAERWICSNGLTNLYMPNYGDTRFPEFEIVSAVVGAGIVTTRCYHGWDRILFLSGSDFPHSDYRISAHVPSTLKIRVLTSAKIFGFVCGSGEALGWTVRFLVNNREIGNLSHANQNTSEVMLVPGIHILEIVLSEGERWGAHTAWGITFGKRMAESSSPVEAHFLQR